MSSPLHMSVPPPRRCSLPDTYRRFGSLCQHAFIRPVTAAGHLSGISGRLSTGALRSATARITSPPSSPRYGSDRAYTSQSVMPASHTEYILFMGVKHTEWYPSACDVTCDMGRCRRAISYIHIIYTISYIRYHIYAVSSSYIIYTYHIFDIIYTRCRRAISYVQRIS